MDAGQKHIRRDGVVDYSKRDPDDADDDYDDDSESGSDDDLRIDPEEDDRGGDGADED